MKTLTAWNKTIIVISHWEAIKLLFRGWTGGRPGDSHIPTIQINQRGYKITGMDGKPNL